MESNLVHAIELVQELKMKREKVDALQVEINRLNLQLIEKESQLAGKTMQLNATANKMKKMQSQHQQTRNESSTRLKSLQEENQRYENEILEAKENFRKTSMDKQRLHFKLNYFHNEIQQIAKQVEAIISHVSDVKNKQSDLIKCVQQIEEQQSQITGMCEMIHANVAQVQREVDDKCSGMAEEKERRHQLETKLQHSYAKITLLQKGIPDGSSGALEKRVQLLEIQLTMAKEREDKLAADLECERRENLNMEMKIQQLADNLVRCIAVNNDVTGSGLTGEQLN